MAEPSKQQLEHDIAETREELAATISEIERRVSPVALARRHRQELVIAGAGVAALLLVLRSVAAIRRHHERSAR